MTQNNLDTAKRHIDQLDRSDLSFSYFGGEELLEEFDNLVNYFQQNPVEVDKTKIDHWLDVCQRLNNRLVADI